MTLAPVTEFVSRNWLFTILVAIIAGLAKKVFTLHEEKAFLELEVLTLKNSNSKSEADSVKRIADLETENSQLKKTISEKYSDEAVLSKYKIESGVAIHRQENRPYCVPCLVSQPRVEVPLTDDGEYLRCPVTSSHFVVEKPEGSHKRNYSPPPRNMGYGFSDE